MLLMTAQDSGKYFGDSMEERKKCISCDKPFLVFQGYFLHPETPCNGLLDFIEIEAVIADEFLHEKFEKLYGKPEIDDYARIGMLEAENNGMSKQLLSLSNEIIELKNQIEVKDKKLNNPLIKFLLRIFYWL